MHTKRSRWGSIAAVAALGAVTWGTGAVSTVQAAPAGLVQQPAAVIASANMEYVGTIPIESPGVSHAVREVGGERLLYVNGSKGLTIYGIDDPADPQRRGFLPLPHSQNEDIQVSEDGTRAIIAADGGLPVPVQATRGLYIVDTSDPDAPTVVASLDNASGGTNHTATCADEACDWIYANRGSIYHVTVSDDGTTQVAAVGSWFDADPQKRVRSSHALNRSVHPDPANPGESVTIMISDSEPRLVMDATDPANPVVLATSDPADHEGDGYLQHNNARPNAADWRPRSAEDTTSGEVAPRGPARGLPANVPQKVKDRFAEDQVAQPAKDPFGGDLRPGELLIGNSESNVVPQCDDQSGGLTTFSMANFDEGDTLEPLHTFRPVNGSWIDGNPGANALGCSGHWFDIQDGDTLIAASWYEHGVKVIEVLPDYSMQEVGFFQPVVGSAGAASWVVDDDGTEYIFSTDYVRGLDIIEFHRDAPRPTEAEMRTAALAVSKTPVAATERLICDLAARS